MTVQVLLGLAPILLFFGPLLAGRYIGAEKIERLAARARRTPAPRRSLRLPKPRRAPALAPHGSLLLARRMAGRAPPRAQLAL